ncbi:putative transposase [Corynebacterium pilosum]|uniref:Putative transposase n=1 Tax=Corynebacterium pilosum TaxID=35756 RepID=A0A376CL58_9CORY|nr:putative transposase [Corynebacterium pilosum]
MRRIQQKRYMSLTALDQTKTMMNANVIDAGDTTQEVA